MNTPKIWGWNALRNRWTGERHQHRREIARRTTNPGTPERRRAYAEASVPQ